MGTHIVHELPDVQVVDKKEGVAYLYAAVEVRRAALGHACNHSTLEINGTGTAGRKLHIAAWIQYRSKWNLEELNNP